MHIVLTAGLLLDGPAIAAETLVGKALGAKNDRAQQFNDAVRATAVLAGIAAAGLTLVLLAFGDTIIGLIVPRDAENAPLFAEALKYYPWAALSPLFVVLPFQMDGYYIGATRGSALRDSMIGAALLFALGVLFIAPAIGNHGLWDRLWSLHDWPVPSFCGWPGEGLGKSWVA